MPGPGPWRQRRRVIEDASINTTGSRQNGQGSRKIFRDEVWGKLRFVFQADHRYYKAHSLYDFPQKNYKMRRMNFIMTLLTKIPPFRKKFLKVIKEQMVKPLQSVVEKK